MSIDYIDASALTALILHEAGHERVDAFVAAAGKILVSDLCLAECSSAISLLGRRRSLSDDAVRNYWRQLDLWIETFGQRTATESQDVARADAIVRRYDLKLRAPDAIHVAAAERFGVRLVTSDKRMLDAARSLGVVCLNPLEQTA